MLNVPENELLSAYLDGELTAEEQARAEQLLGTNPAAQQLLNELRALGTNLQSLPVHELKADLSECVLRRAEQRVLSGSAEWDLESDSPSCDQNAVPRPAALRRVLRPRNLAWPAIALVVALVLLVLDRGSTVDRQDEGQIARKPDESVDRIAPAVKIPAAEIPAVKVRALEIPVVKNSAVENGATGDDEVHATKDPDGSVVANVDSVETPTEVAGADTPEPASPNDRLLVVRCNVPTEAIGKQTLGEILVKRKIPRLETTDRATGKTYVEVELTPTQMRALMADLKARPETFAGLSIPPTPGAAGPRIPSAARAIRGMERPTQVTPAAPPRNVSPGGKKSGLAGPGSSSRRTEPSNRSEPKIRVRFELNVVGARTEVKRKESDSAEKTDSQKSAGDAP